MCEFCKIEEDDELEISAYRELGSKRDGSLRVSLCINRYQDKHKAPRRNELILALEVLRGRMVQCETLAEKKIKIKYCPFCGEKL